MFGPFWGGCVAFPQKVGRTSSGEPRGVRPQARPISQCAQHTLYPPFMIPLPVLLEQAWARALPGREAGAQNELMRTFKPCPLSGKPDIEPTSPNDRV
jgi:hypothetical protein